MAIVRNAYWSVGAVIEQLRNQITHLGARYLAGVLPVFDAGLTTVDGWRAAYYTYTISEGEEQTEQLVLVTLGADDTMPSRSILASPLANGVQANFVTTVGETLITAADYEDAFELIYLPMLDAIYTLWGTAESTEAVLHISEPITGQITVVTSAMMIRDVSGPMVGVEELRLNTSTDPEEGFANVTNDGLAYPPVSVAGGKIDTSAIVEALNAIAMRGFDISLNHGSVIFSANGNVITE